MAKRNLLSCLLVLIFLGGCGDKKDFSTDVLYDSDPQKDQLLKTIEKKYESPEAHYQLGKIYQLDGLFDKAEFHYNVAKGFDPANKRVQAALVKVNVDRQDEAKARLLADMFMREAAVSAEGSLRLGKSFQREGLDEYAILCFQQASNLAPNSAAIYKQMGYYHMSKGDHVRAEENLRRSFQLNPSQPEVAGALGRMGVMVQIPRGPEEKADKMDKIIEEEDSVK